MRTATTERDGTVTADQPGQNVRHAEPAAVRQKENDMYLGGGVVALIVIILLLILIF